MQPYNLPTTPEQDPTTPFEDLDLDLCTTTIVYTKNNANNANCAISLSDDFRKRREEKSRRPKSRISQPSVREIDQPHQQSLYIRHHSQRLLPVVSELDKMLTSSACAGPDPQQMNHLEGQQQCTELIIQPLQTQAQVYKALLLADQLIKELRSVMQAISSLGPFMGTT